ncbi:integrase [Archaeoglobus profundus]|nr:integrase [Archaeoglobus profundus]
MKWLERKVEPDTARFYIKYLDEYLMDSITDVQQVIEILSSIDSIGKRRWFERGFRNLLNFLEIKGYPLDFIERFRKAVKVENAGVREIFIDTNELLEAWRDKISRRSRKMQILFKLFVYSGVRGKQAVAMLNNFDPLKIVYKDRIARYPIANISKGSKKGYWVYMPSKFAKELVDFIKSFNGKMTKKTIDNMRFGRVSASTIRKWHLNFLIENGVPESVADFIQGRASLTVGSTHYLNKTKQADEWYSRVVDRFPIKG